MLSKKLIAAALISLVGCSDAATDPSSAPPDFAGTTRVVLRAWEDTRVGLPPLAVTRADSVEAVLAFVRSKSTGWRMADSLPGNPLPAEFYAGTAVQGRFGILDVEGDSGFFIAWRGSVASVRPASDAELGQFLAFFGIAVIVVE